MILFNWTKTILLFLFKMKWIKIWKNRNVCLLMEYQNQEVVWWLEKHQDFELDWVSCQLCLDQLITAPSKLPISLLEEQECSHSLLNVMVRIQWNQVCVKPSQHYVMFFHLSTIAFATDGLDHPTCHLRTSFINTYRAWAHCSGAATTSSFQERNSPKVMDLLPKAPWSTATPDIPGHHPLLW